MPVLTPTHLPAPNGMDASTEVQLLQPGRARQLANLLPSLPGSVRGQVRAVDVLPAPMGAPVDGLAYYYGLHNEDDRLLMICGGSLYAAQVTPGTPVPTITNVGAVGAGFTPGVRVRSAAYDQETMFVQADGAIQPLRYDGTGLYPLGIDAPPAPTVFLQAPTSGVSHKAGIVHYRMSYLDSKYRESSLSPATVVTFGTGQAAVVMAPEFTDPQTRFAYLYATTASGATYYQIATFTKDAQTGLVQPLFWEDNAPDSIVNTGTPWVDPDSFEANNRPDPASCICTHKNHVWLNSMVEVAVLQISNLNAPTQWSRVSNLPTQGTQLRVTSDQGDPVVQMLTFGSILALLKRRTGMHAILGDLIDEYTVRAIQTRPCVSPDAFVRCDNELWYLADDGVYSVDFTGTFLIHKVSKDIEPFFLGLNRQPGGRDLLQQSVACYAERVYYLAVGSVIYCYDFDVQGWYQLLL